MKKRMFNDKFKLTDMVIQRRKTMTSDILPELGAETKLVGTNENGDFEFRIGNNYNTVAIKPKFKVGEVVAVAQSYETVYQKEKGIDHNKKVLLYWKYRGTTPWRNKMYVRANEMPYKIRIEKVKCERLNDISEEDIIKEGITKYVTHRIGCLQHTTSFEFEIPGMEQMFKSGLSAFQYLAEKIFGKGTWERNPYRIAYEFTLIK